jgi:acyl-CoA synthetase (AMP-forming)/AMP-acid ligase II
MTSAKKAGIFLLSLGLVFALAGTTACQQNATETAAQLQKPSNEFEGTVKSALGKYLYLPPAQGFDIILQGFDAGSLIGKDIRVRGELLLDKPSIFRADAVDVKDASGAYSNVFTRTQDLTIEDFIDVKAREVYPVLTITGVNKPEEWENKGKGKVYGKIQEATVKEGGLDKAVTYIVLTDDKGKEVGKIIVDKFSDFSRYYLKKLRLFDKFWFYLNVKDSVDKRIRPRTKELFHADVLFAGLF